MCIFVWAMPNSIWKDENLVKWNDKKHGKWCYNALMDRQVSSMIAIVVLIEIVGHTDIFSHLYIICFCINLQSVKSFLVESTSFEFVDYLRRRWL